MARGGESKSGEEQQEAAARAATTAKQPLSPEQIARLHTKESLLLSRKRAYQQLQDSRHPQHRAMLQKALADLDAQLAKLEQ
jgi:hypothetical protein